MLHAEAKDEMFAYTDIKESPWWVVDADDKRAARLNLMSHLLSLVPYKPPQLDEIALPARQHRAYARPPKATQTMVPARYEIA